MSGDRQFYDSGEFSGSDTALIGAVRTAMRDEVADVTAPAALLAGVRRRYTRRVTARRVGVGVVPVAVAAGVAAAVVVPAGSVPGAPGTSTTVPAPVNVAYVKAQISKAMTAAQHDIVYEHSVATDGSKYSKPGQRAVFETWFKADRTALRVRVTVDGKPVVDTSLAAGGHNVSVDYRQHTYWQDREHSTDPRKGQGTYGAPEVITPAQIRKGIAQGDITVVGAGAPSRASQPSSCAGIPT